MPQHVNSMNLTTTKFNYYTTNETSSNLCCIRVIFYYVSKIYNVLVDGCAMSVLEYCLLNHYNKKLKKILNHFY